MYEHCVIKLECYRLI